jgi:hypothetical protein
MELHDRPFRSVAHPAEIHEQKSGACYECLTGESQATRHAAIISREPRTRIIRRLRSSKSTSASLFPVVAEPLACRGR